MNLSNIQKFLEKNKFLVTVIVVLFLFPTLLKRLFSTLLSPFTALLANVKDQGNGKAVDNVIKDNPSQYTFIDGRVASVAELDVDARYIQKNLGLDRPWYDPSGWTEDEAKIVGVLAKYNKPVFALLVSRYQAVVNRGLVSDLTEYLSNSDLSKVNHLFV